MAVIGKVIKASSSSVALAEEVVKIFSKDKVLKDLELDYVGAEGAYEVGGAIDIELAGSYYGQIDEESLESALESSLKKNAGKLEKAFKDFENVAPIVSLGGIEVVEADDPDLSDTIYIHIIFEYNDTINASRGKGSLKAKRAKLVRVNRPIRAKSNATRNRRVRASVDDAITDEYINEFHALSRAVSALIDVEESLEVAFESIDESFQYSGSGKVGFSIGDIDDLQKETKKLQDKISVRLEKINKTLKTYGVEI